MCPAGTKLTACESRLRGRRFVIAHDLWATGNSVGASLHFAAGHLGLADKGRAFLDDEAGRFQIALQGAARLQFTTLSDGDVAVNLAEDGD